MSIQDLLTTFEFSSPSNTTLEVRQSPNFNFGAIPEEWIKKNLNSGPPRMNARRRKRKKTVIQPIKKRKNSSQRTKKYIISTDKSKRKTQAQPSDLLDQPRPFIQRSRDRLRKKPMPQVFRTEIEDNSEAILKTLQQKSTKITASPIKSICEKKENLCTINLPPLISHKDIKSSPVKCWADVFKKPGFSVQNGAESESETEDDEDNLFDIPVFAMPSQVAPPLEPDTPLSEFIPQDSDESPKILPLESGSPEKEKVPLKSKRSLKVDEDFVMPDVDDDDEDWVEEDTSAVDEKILLSKQQEDDTVPIMDCDFLALMGFDEFCRNDATFQWAQNISNLTDKTCSIYHGVSYRESRGCFVGQGKVEGKNRWFGQHRSQHELAAIIRRKCSIWRDQGLEITSDFGNLKPRYYPMSKYIGVRWCSTTEPATWIGEIRNSVVCMGINQDDVAQELRKIVSERISLGEALNPVLGQKPGSSYISLPPPEKKYTVQNAGNAQATVDDIPKAPHVAQKRKRVVPLELPPSKKRKLDEADPSSSSDVDFQETNGFIEFKLCQNKSKLSEVHVHRYFCCKSPDCKSSCTSDFQAVGLRKCRTTSCSNLVCENCTLCFHCYLKISYGTMLNIVSIPLEPIHLDEGDALYLCRNELTCALDCWTNILAFSSHFKRAISWLRYPLTRCEEFQSLRNNAADLLIAIRQNVYCKEGPQIHLRNKLFNDFGKLMKKHRRDMDSPERILSLWWNDLFLNFMDYDGTETDVTYVCSECNHLWKKKLYRTPDEVFRGVISRSSSIPESKARCPKCSPSVGDRTGEADFYNHHHSVPFLLLQQPLSGFNIIHKADQNWKYDLIGYIAYYSVRCDSDPSGTMPHWSSRAILPGGETIFLDNLTQIRKDLRPWKPKNDKSWVCGVDKFSLQYLYAARK